MSTKITLKSTTLLTMDSMIATSISLPMEMLNAAVDIERSSYFEHRKNWKQPILHIAGTNQRPVISAGSLQIQPNILLETIELTELIIIPALWRNPIQTNDTLSIIKPWLIKQYKQGSIICAVGTGAFILAETGLLNHKPATTHWFFLDQFSKRYPNVIVKPNHLITQSDRLYCAGSVNSVADLMIHLMDLFFNTETASRVEQQFSPEVRRSADEVFYAFEKHSPHHDELVINIQQYLRENYSDKINMEYVAQKFSISQRTLSRRFKNATGTSPAQYLCTLRLKVTKELLKKSNLSLYEIAQTCGFKEPSYFSKAFKQSYQLSPRQYRNSVRAKLFTL